MNEFIQQAVQILRSGGTVAFPTETVYGLGANASDPEAVAKIFQIKGRPLGHPLIVHIAGAEQLNKWAVDISPEAFRLAKAFWPGPLTLILKKSPAVLDVVTGHQTTVGLRVPRHPVAHALLEAFGGGLAAPSANRFGKISPTTARAVHEELGATVDLILEGGQCEIGLESTIVDLSVERPVLLRPGGISAADINEVLQTELGKRCSDSPRVSGSMLSHYAPATLTKTVSSVKDFLNNLSEADLPCALLVTTAVKSTSKEVDCKRMPETPKEYAHALYATLRECDRKGYKQIVIEAVPNTKAWDAIRDRLQRACGLISTGFVE